MSERRENARMVGKLAIVALGMFAFGYALIPVYKRICEVTGINILALILQERFGIAIPDEDIEAHDLRVLGSLVEYVAHRAAG